MRGSARRSRTVVENIRCSARARDWSQKIQRTLVGQFETVEFPKSLPASRHSRRVSMSAQSEILRGWALALPFFRLCINGC